MIQCDMIDLFLNYYRIIRCALLLFLVLSNHFDLVFFGPLFVLLLLLLTTPVHTYRPSNCLFLAASLLLLVARCILSFGDTIFDFSTCGSILLKAAAMACPLHCMFLGISTSTRQELRQLNPRSIHSIEIGDPPKLC